MFAKNIINMNNIENDVKNFILKCFTITGFNTNVDDVKVLCLLFTKEVETNWRRYVRVSNKGQDNEQWDLNEIFYFIELGLSNVFGDYFGISLITFKKFEHAYTKQEYTHYRKLYLLKNPLPPKIELVAHTESGKDDMFITSMLDKLKNGTFAEHDAAVYFDFLCSKNATKHEILEKYYDEGAKLYLESLHKRLNLAHYANDKEMYSNIKTYIEMAKENKYDSVELDYFTKVYYIRYKFSDIENINKLEEFLKTKFDIT